MSLPSRVAVLGAGSFGTALSSVLLRNGHEVRLWCYEPGHAAEIAAAGRNTRYLQEVALPGLHPTQDLGEALDGAQVVLFVSPSHHNRGLVRSVRTRLDDAEVLLSATKGIERDGLLMAEVFEQEVLAAHHDRLAYLSGPSFAREVGAGQPTAVVVASRAAAPAERVQRLFSGPSFRVYTSHDVVGVELGGAIKNVIAIGAGICDGLGFGHNARAAIITRGLAEMSRLGAAMGADPMTFMGLAGMGDLVLTCTGDLSRNRTVGLRIAKGLSLSEVTASLGGQVAEGVLTATSTLVLARRFDVDMPIAQVVHEVLHEGKDPRQAVVELMTRPLKRERD